jgi:hypothetical protein
MMQECQHFRVPIFPLHSLSTVPFPWDVPEYSLGTDLINAIEARGNEQTSSVPR